MSINRAVKSVAFLWAGSVLGAAFAFFTQAFLARMLSSEDFGVFASSIAFASLVAPLAGFGVPQFWLKAFGEEGWTARKWWPASFFLILISTSVVCFFVVFWAVFWQESYFSEGFLYCILFFIVGQLFFELVGSRLQLEERYFFLAFWQVIPHLVRLLIILLFSIFYAGDFLYYCGLSYIFSSVILIVLGGVIIAGMVKGNFDLVGHERHEGHVGGEGGGSSSARELFSQVWPYGVSMLFNGCYLQLNVVAIKYFDGDSAAASYNVAFVFFMAISILPSVIYQKFLISKIHRWASSDRGRLYIVYKKGNFLMFILGGVAMLGVWCTSWFFLPAIFGGKYMDSIQLVNIMVLALPCMFLAFSAGATLTTREHMKIKVLLMGVVAVLNVIALIVFVPAWGAVGGAIALALSYFLLMAIYYAASELYVFRVERGSLVGGVN